MNTLETLKAKHMAAANSQWEEAVARIKALLNRKDAVRTLTTRLLTASTSTRFAMFGGDGRNEKMLSYPWLSSAEDCALLEGVAQFIEHDLLDDGDPGIGYMRYDPYEGFTPCSKEHEDAKPYIHRCVEVLRHTVPEAPLLHVDNTLEVLDWYEGKRTRRRNRILRDIQEAEQEGRQSHWDEDDVAAYSPRPDELAMQALVEELTEPVTLP